MNYLEWLSYVLKIEHSNLIIRLGIVLVGGIVSTALAVVWAIDYAHPALSIPIGGLGLFFIITYLVYLMET